ncbi:hypothetical protein FSARC_10679 [Fusarium sarcochroum]|uniref:Uncharacterized protein n=1 Tax=Fusarium sarcochroum TaxID=1208366 RepID=A0A8H4TK71_9HYPO|nr:hypothetical protein FSARC_10679 [Fusarium sarcochroum]
MAGLEKNFPSTLRERMNDDKEVSIFQSWFRHDPAKAIDSSSALKRMLTSRSELREAIKRYQAVQAAESGDNFWSSCDLEKCSWSQVFDELEEAKTSYWKRARNNPVRSFLRKGGGITRNLKPLLEGIPQDDGMGLIKGAFVIIFKAVQDRSSARDKILESFITMPISVVDAETLRQNYPDDQSLFSAVQCLHDELVKCIPSMINVLLRRGNHSKTKKFTKSVFGDPVAEVEKILKPVEIAEKNLDRCRRDLNTQGIATTGTKVQLLHDILDQGMTSLQKGLGGVDDNVTTLHQKVDKILAWQEEFSQAQRESDDVTPTHALTELMNPFYCMIEDIMRAKSLSPVVQVDRSFTAQRSIRQNVMEAVCTVDERIDHARELGYILRRYHDFSITALARAKYLLETQRFRRWFMSADSDILLVDGHCSDQSIGRLAPTSLTCAGLVKTFIDQASTSESLLLPQTPRIVLYFFAGQHIDSSNGLYGPHGLIRSLVDQLLRQWPDEEFLDLRLPKDGPGTWSFSTAYLCYIFEQLVCQLSSNSPICCVIDGISYFETSLNDWVHDLTDIINCFLVCRDEKSAYEGRGTIKFLLVSPDKSTRIRHLVDGYDQVDLRAGNMHSRAVSHHSIVDDIIEGDAYDRGNWR